MNDLFCYKSKKGIVFLSNNKEQNLFSVNNNIIASRNADFDLGQLVKNASFFTKKNSLQDFLQGNYSKNQDLYIGNYKNGFNLLKQPKSSNYFSKIDYFDFNSSSHSFVQTTISNDQNNGFDFSYCSDIEEMLGYVYKLVKNGGTDTSNLQFGILDKHDAKVLFSKNIEFLHAPDNYANKGNVDDKKFENNSKFHELLLVSLDTTYELLKKRPKYNYKKSFFGIGKKLLDKEINESRKDTAEIVDRFLDYNNGIIERYTIGGFIDEMHDVINPKPKPKLYNPKKRDFQNILNKELLPKHEKSVILRLANKGYGRNMQDMVYSLQKELGMEINPLNNLPCVTITGDAKDINKFYNYMGSQKYSKFSRTANSILSTTTYIEQNHAYGIPELIDEILRGIKNKFTPIRSNHYNNNDVLWNLQNINAREANEITRGSGVNVAVLDTGCDFNHTEISDNFNPALLGYNVINPGEDPMDGNEHGTHVAGTIAGNSTGVAPGTNLYAVKVLSDQGSGSSEGVLRGVDWCITNNMNVINLSLGSKNESELAKELYAVAENKGLITCAAAGNDGYGPHYPSGFKSVISVTAVDKENHHAPFSNIYYTNNISAPGVGIESSVPNEGYATFNGTSMATPHIAGVCALMYSMNKMNKSQVQDIFKKTALKLGNPNDPDNFSVYGEGLVQADKAVGTQAGFLSRWM